MANAAKERSDQGLNSESFAHRVFTYSKRERTAEPGDSPWKEHDDDHEKMDERRQQMLMAVAHEMSPLFYVLSALKTYSLIVFSSFLPLFFSSVYGGSDIVSVIR